MDVFKTLLLDTPDALNAITGTLQIANGGTGATSAAGARDNLLPDYAGNVGKVLTVNAGATDVEWTTNGAGTVTSVDVSGGTTGLTTSGGPVTSSGTITLAGTLAVANGGTGITSLGSGVATFLGTPSSANLAAAVADETGTGALVFASSPTLVTPTLGAATATSINGVTVTGTSTPALSVTGTTAVSGTNTGDQTTITGNAGTATTLETARNINGVSFNGSADITVAADAGTLTGATLASGVTASSLTSLGTIASLVATTADINGGTIDATTIGATTPSTGAFTTLSSTGATSLATGTTGLGIFNSAPNSYLPGIAGVAIGPVENASLSLADTASTKYWNTYNNNSTLKWYLSAAAYSTTGATGDVMALSSTGLAVTGALSSTGAITPSQTAGIVGTTTNNNADAGAVGEYVEGQRSSASALGITPSLTVVDVTSISLTAGDWDVRGIVWFNTGGIAITFLAAAISTTSATLPSLNAGGTGYAQLGIPFTSGGPGSSVSVILRLSLSTTTTVYLLGQAGFTSGAPNCFGTIAARRVR
jgi:hypothetical protein